MAVGELTRTAEVSQADLPPGAVITPTGRISAAKMYQPATPSGPFKPAQLARLDEALTLASRETGLDFSVYLGALGRDTRAGAERLFDTIGPRERESVLVAVSPGERVVEIVTGEVAAQRLSERGAKLAVMSMVASFKEGDLIGGLVSGLRMMTDQAGSVPKP
ncbi:MAG: DUF5130 family protein [Haloechinothrix sp.]